MRPATASGEPTYSDPLYWYSHDAAAAVMGGIFYRGATFPPRYRQGYYFGDYMRNLIQVLLVDEHNELLGVRDFDTSADSPVDFTVWEGSLFFVSINGGAIYRISYIGS